MSSFWNDSSLDNSNSKPYADRFAIRLGVGLNTVKSLYSGHPWDVANWLLYKGGLIIQCTFQQGSPLWGIIIGGCFREVTSYTGLR